MWKQFVACNLGLSYIIPRATKIVVNFLTWQAFRPRSVEVREIWTDIINITDKKMNGYLLLLFTSFNGYMLAIWLLRLCMVVPPRDFDIDNGFWMSS
jgi:hypothetical protein